MHNFLVLRREEENMYIEIYIGFRVQVHVYIYIYTLLVVSRE